MPWKSYRRIVAGFFATGVPPGPRIEISSDDANLIKFFTGDAAEAAPGEIRVESLGAGFDALSLAILAPRAVANPDIPRAMVAVRTDKTTGAAKISIEAAATSVQGPLDVAGDLRVSGVGQRRTVVATADQTRPGVTLGPSSHLTMPVVAGATYKADALILYTAGAGTDLIYAWDVPAGTVGKRAVLTADISSPLGNVINVNGRVSGDFSLPFECGGSGGFFRQAREEMTFTAGASGTVTLKFCERAGGTGATILAHSRLTLERIA